MHVRVEMHCELLLHIRSDLALQTRRQVRVGTRHRIERIPGIVEGILEAADGRNRQAIVTGAQIAGINDLVDLTLQLGYDRVSG